MARQGCLGLERRAGISLGLTFGMPFSMVYGAMSRSLTAILTARTVILPTVATQARGLGNLVLRPGERCMD